MSSGKRKRHSPEQIIAKLREIDAALAGGASVDEVARQQGVSAATIGRWRTTYGGAKGPEVKRLKELEQENARLKKLVADMALDIQMLKELAKGNF
jgi:putative transposase